VELPAETQAEMPAIKIGVHLFSETPASRRASINGRLMREGQQVDEDLVLMEITKQGAILSYRGRRFSLPVFPK
jgi:general secretion pathway protein B